MIAIIILMLGLLPLFSSVSAADVTVNIHIAGEKPQTRFDNPVIVAGIWHYINITLEDQNFQTISLKFYNGSSMPVLDGRDETNYYEWKYDGTNQEWIDLNEYGGYTYIKNDSCQKAGNTYSFCAGIKDTLPSPPFYHENWTLEVYNDQDELYSKEVVVEKPTLALAKSHADFIQFRVNPFTEMNDNGSDYFTIENTGNLPLDITIDYPTYNEFIEFKNLSAKLSPYSSSKYEIIMHSGSWAPGIRSDITGTMEGGIQESLIIPTAQLSFSSAFELNLSTLEIFVGHANHEIVPVVDDIIFQYEKSLTMNEEEIREIHVYLSGNGESVLNISSDGNNVTIREIRSEDAVVDTPITITSVNTSEHTVTITVEALRENKVGTIHYELTVGGVAKLFTTTINVDPPLSHGEETSLDAIPLTTIIVILCVILVVGYMIFSYMRRERR